MFMPPLSSYVYINSRAVHRSELTNGKIKRVSPMLKVLKECPNPRKYFDPAKFLEALRLDSLLPRKEVDTSLYVTNRAKLEQMYPYLFEGQKDAVASVVYSTLRYLVSEEAEARAVRDKCKRSSQHVQYWYTTKHVISHCVYVCIAQLMHLYIPLISIQLQSTWELDGMP